MFIPLFQMKNQQSKYRVFFDLNHPADFHFFKHLMKWMNTQNIPIKVVARDKECLHLLLDDAGIAYTSRGRGKNSITGKYLYGIQILLLLLFMFIKFRPNLACGLSSPYLVIASRILGKPCITFDDTDNNPRLLPLIRKSTFLISPSTYPHNFHKRHFHLPVLKELAYLHPGLFNSEVERSGLFFRITRTDSIHHSTSSKLDHSVVLERMESLSREHTVFLSSELEIKYLDNTSIRPANPIQIHKDLASCNVFWGNSATMAAEAAVLGIPAVFVSAEKFAYITELEQYGLLYYYHPADLVNSLNKLEVIMNGDPSEDQLLHSRKKLLREKLDISAFMVWFIDNLPQSADTMASNPEYALRFISGNNE